jgi:DNA-binding NarL/FixJ family response regulator
LFNINILKTGKMKKDEPTNDIYDILTIAEVKVRKLLINGRTNKEIADILNISFYTVRRHRQNILQRTNQHNISGLIKFAINKGLTIEP